jgi:hypothetical protein
MNSIPTRTASNTRSSFIDMVMVMAVISTFGCCRVWQRDTVRAWHAVAAAL